MTRTAKSFVVLFALLALAGAQVFGLQRGFLCECSGVTVETTYEYCHHVHGSMHEPCAEDHHEHDGQGSAPSGHDHERENQGGSHEHTPLKVELTAFSQGKDASAAVPVIPAPAPLPFAELPAFLAFLIAAPGGADADMANGPPPDARGGALPGIRETAKCMVLLI